MFWNKMSGDFWVTLFQRIKRYFGTKCWAIFVGSLCTRTRILLSLVPPNQTFSQQKMGTQPSTILQIYKCVQPIFEIWFSFDHNNIGHYHQQNVTAPKQIYRLALRLPKYISVKLLLHDSSGLPYVKHRLLSYAAIGHQKGFPRIL